VNALYCLEEWRGEQRISPPGDNFTLRGQSSLLGNNVAPGGQSLPLGAKLRMGLRAKILAKVFLTTDPKPASAFAFVKTIVGHHEHLESLMYLEALLTLNLGE
jgi:hypothetical protein